MIAFLFVCVSSAPSSHRASHLNWNPLLSPSLLALFGSSHLRTILGLEQRLLSHMDERTAVNLVYRDNVHLKHHDVKPALKLQSDPCTLQPKPDVKIQNWRLTALVKHAIEARPFHFLQAVSQHQCLQPSGLTIVMHVRNRFVPEGALQSSSQ